MEHREINMHSHESWKISYVHEGKGTHYFEDDRIESIKEGEFVFVSPDVSHCITYDFGSDLPLDYLVEYVHLSPEYLSRYFKKCTDLNLSEFIAKTRIEKAK